MTDYSIWPATNGPNTATGPGDITRALLFRLSAPGWLRKIRFYRGTTAIGPATGEDAVLGRIYAVAGETPVAGTDVEFTLSGTGWQEADVVPAVALAANTSYKVAVLSDNYTATAGYFASGPGVGGIVNGILIAPDAGGNPSGIGGIQQGSFRQPTSGMQYPNQYFGGGNYWVDVVVADEDPGSDVRDVAGSATLTLTPSVDSSKLVSSSASAVLGMVPEVDEVKQVDQDVERSLVLTVSVTDEADGPGVSAPTSDVLCSPWATYVDVPVRLRSAHPDLTEDDWTRLLLRSSELLWAFSGRRWYGGGCTETSVLRSSPPNLGQGAWPYHSTWGACGCWSYYPDAFTPQLELLPASFRHVGGPVAIRLPRSPITGIVSVEIGGQPFEDFRWLRSGWLERTDGSVWGTCSGDTEVTYLFGEPPPLGGKDAAIVLAAELAASESGSELCRLPSNLVSLTRQALTMEFVAASEYLDRYRTGLPEVDMWLNAVNPNARQVRSRVWSPDIPSTVRSPQ